MTILETAAGRRLRPGGRVQAPTTRPARHNGAGDPPGPAGAQRTLPAVGAASGEREQAGFEELVPRAIAGDDRAWEALVTRLQRVAWHSIAGFDLPADDRKDAFAATFFRLSERLPTIREPAKLPGWVATTARNEVHTLLRARRRLTATDPHDLPATPEAPVGESRLIDDELRDAVRRGFDTLSERCRELLRLVTLDPPLSYAEVGELLHMPHGSIGPTRQRCLDQLRRTAELQPYLDGS